jgi:prepilin-type N-terminal cleavage/methylation domain-containing protein
MAAPKNGVTLAELIVVVLIIGVMASVTIPRMGFSLINTGKTQTTAYKIAAAIRYARSLAISNAANNAQGFAVNMIGSGSYTGYKVVDLTSPTPPVETVSIDSNNVSCTGADDFIFKPLGNRDGDTDSLTVSGGEKTYVISVITATGMIKCEEQ